MNVSGLMRLKPRGAELAAGALIEAPRRNRTIVSMPASVRICAKARIRSGVDAQMGNRETGSFQ